jgi:hypothetical protein
MFVRVNTILSVSTGTRDTFRNGKNRYLGPTVRVEYLHISYTQLQLRMPYGVYSRE